MRGMAGSAAAPAAKCRKFRRGSFILNLPLHSHHSITPSAICRKLTRFCETVFDDDVTAVEITELGEAFDYGFVVRGFFLASARMPEKTHARDKPDSAA